MGDSNTSQAKEEDAQFDISRLEQYTEKVPNEVLRVHALVDGEEDQVLIFKVTYHRLINSLPSPSPLFPIPSTESSQLVIGPLGWWWTSQLWQCHHIVRFAI